MFEYFAPARSAILDSLHEIMTHRRDRFDAVSKRWGIEALERLEEYTSRGKLIRGCLVRLGFELCAGRAPNADEERAIAQAGAAMELFQSGLLIHDDIMDRDRLRRGKPTIHIAYAEALEQARFQDPAHNGSSLAICGGDLAYFLAFEILAGLPVENAIRQGILALAARELSLVGLAQMQDVANGAHGPATNCPEPDEEAILQVFRYKTGRYTFSLPLAMGAWIAGADASRIDALEAGGELLGMLFQIKDDELGLFADPQVLGKPVGADIRENKKTLYRLRLLQGLSGAELEKVRGLYGKENIGSDDVALVQGLIEERGVRAGLNDMMQDLARQTRRVMQDCLDAASSRSSRAFLDLLDYSLNRVA